MLLVFDDVPDEGLQIDCRLDLAETAAEQGGHLLDGPARLVGRARHGTRGLELSARLSATLRLECSRCLEPVEHLLDCNFSLILVSEAVEFGPTEMRVASTDAQMFYAQQGKADLREVATEQIYLNVPQKVVCRKDCAGLCRACGANRNRIECDCRIDDLDPRFAALQALKNDHGESET